MYWISLHITKYTPSIRLHGLNPWILYSYYIIITFDIQLEVDSIEIAMYTDHIYTDISMN